MSGTNFFMPTSCILEQTQNLALIFFFFFFSVSILLVILSIHRESLNNKTNAQKIPFFW